MKNYSKDISRQYHIQVANGEVGRYVILPGDPKRCKKIAQYFEDPVMIADNREFIMGALGPAKAAMLIVISQLIVAYVIELFGMFGVEQEPFVWRKVLGMLIAIAGIVIFKWE